MRSITAARQTRPGRPNFFVRYKWLNILAIPGIVYFIVFKYLPMLGIYMAFTNYKPTKLGYWHDLTSAKFVGLQWFDYFFQNGFANIMRNTLITSVLTLLFSFPAPIILALMLNEVQNAHIKKFIQIYMYILFRCCPMQVFTFCLPPFKFI